MTTQQWRATGVVVLLVVYAGMYFQLFTAVEDVSLLSVLGLAVGQVVLLMLVAGVGSGWQGVELRTEVERAVARRRASQQRRR